MAVMAPVGRCRVREEAFARRSGAISPQRPMHGIPARSGRGREKAFCNRSAQGEMDGWAVL